MNPITPNIKPKKLDFSNENITPKQLLIRKTKEIAQTYLQDPSRTTKIPWTNFMDKKIHLNNGLSATVFKPAYVPDVCKMKVNQYYPRSSCTNEFLSKAIEICQTSSFEWKGESIPLTKWSTEGSHCVLFKIKHPNPIIDSISNDEILLKTFTDHSILTTHLSTKVPSNAADNVLAQYQELQKIGLSLPMLYNEPEAKNGCGYFLFENIPNPLTDQLWDAETPLTQFTDAQKNLLDKIAKLFRICYISHKQGLLTDIPDLSPSNLRWRKNDQDNLVIVDFREEPIDLDEIEMYWNTMIKEFNCKKDDEIYSYIHKEMHKEETF